MNKTAFAAAVASFLIPRVMMAQTEVTPADLEAAQKTTFSLNRADADTGKALLIVKGTLTQFSVEELTAELKTVTSVLITPSSPQQAIAEAKAEIVALQQAEPYALNAELARAVAPVNARANAFRDAVMNASFAAAP